MYRSILNIESISEDNIHVKEEHFPQLVDYVAYLIAICRYRYLVRDYTRFLIVKLCYLIDRELYHKHGYTMTRLYYINYLRGAYNPSIIEALEELCRKGALTHIGAEWSYTILLENELLKHARKLAKTLKEKCNQQNIDYYRIKRTIIKTIKQALKYYINDSLETYIMNLPEIKNTRLGQVISFNNIRQEEKQ